MFIREKKIPNSDRLRIQIVESERVKNRVVQRVVRHIGIAKDSEEAVHYKRIALIEIERLQAERMTGGNLLMDTESSLLSTEFPVKTTEKVSLKSLKLEQHFVEGPKEVTSSLFDELGFNKVLNGSYKDVLKEVVVARSTEPDSKKSTCEKLESQGVEISTDQVYRMMDKLHPEISRMKKIVFSKTSEIFKDKISVVFFDVTTLYFESFESDELRRFGYSKDQKYHTTQVVFALATTENGAPIGYELFPGNTAETQTLLACLSEWKKSFEIGEVVFVADRGMFSFENLSEIEKSGYKFLVAYPMKKLSKDLQESILDRSDYKDVIDAKGEVISSSKEIFLDLNYKKKKINGEKKPDDVVIHGRLIVSYEESRAKKDKKDRDDLLEKLKKKVPAHGTKGLISNKGYLKYVEISGKSTVVLNEEKISSDERWDGLHGIFTNTDLSFAEVRSRYKNLWQIEDTFRLSKHDLKFRPIYHWKKERIESHIAICFMALCIVRRAQYKLSLSDLRLSHRVLMRKLSEVGSSILRDESTGKRIKVPKELGESVQEVCKALGYKPRLSASMLG